MSVFHNVSHTQCAHRLTQAEKIDLFTHGLRAPTLVETSRTASVLGVRFNAGEWAPQQLNGTYRCGSVITTMFRGRSRYCLVRKFIRVVNKDFACVTWFSKPVYPYAPNLLVVKVRLLMRLDPLLPSVLPLDVIDPTPVIVDPDDDGFYMMRLKGYDRVRPGI